MHPTYADAGFLADLIPIKPHEKVPGVQQNGIWRGMSDWQAYEVQPDDPIKWASWGAGVGLRARRFIALDVDINDPEIVDEVVAMAREHWGYAPARIGRSPRMALVYHCPGLKKRVLELRPPGANEWMKIEVLGDGQQFVCEGIHQTRASRTGGLISPWWTSARTV